MKFLVSTLLIGLLSFVTCLYLPWWSIAVVSWLVTLLISQSPLKAFLSGFAAIFILWTLLAFSISSNNEHILAHKMSTIILAADKPLLLVLLTGLIGGLVAGFSALDQ